MSIHPNSLPAAAVVKLAESCERWLNRAHERPRNSLERETAQRIAADRSRQAFDLVAALSSPKETIQ
ncbi:hypothetical protein [Rhodanobacter sp. BL-MT-08]